VRVTRGSDNDSAKVLGGHPGTTPGR
jgi:hypothetical protein